MATNSTNEVYKFINRIRGKKGMLPNHLAILTNITVNRNNKQDIYRKVKVVFIHNENYSSKSSYFIEINIMWEEIGIEDYSEKGLHGSYWSNEKFCSIIIDTNDDLEITNIAGPIIKVEYSTNIVEE
jgi:hypothetical protein